MDSKSPWRDARQVKHTKQSRPTGRKGQQVISVQWSASTDSDRVFRYVGKTQIGNFYLSSQDGMLREFIGLAEIPRAETSLQMMVNVENYINRLNERQKLLNQQRTHNA